MDRNRLRLVLGAVLGLIGVFAIGAVQRSCVPIPTVPADGECGGPAQTACADGGQCLLDDPETFTWGTCFATRHFPECRNIGTRSEGWYWADSGALIAWAQCAGLLPVCTYVGSRSEGWWIQNFLGDFERAFIAWDRCAPAVPPPCASDADCGEGEVCVEGACVPCVGAGGLTMPPYACCPGLVPVSDCLPGEECPISPRYCVDCGNGTCDEHENALNCPADCAPAGDCGGPAGTFCPDRADACLLVEGGPGDWGRCYANAHQPVCREVGTRSEGWYWADTGERIVFAQCAGLLPVCTFVGTRSEGWWVQAALGDYERSFIVYDFCAPAPPECAVDADCAPGERCVDGACVAAPAETCGGPDQAFCADPNDACLLREGGPADWGMCYAQPKQPVCSFVGTRSEGWYWADGSGLIRYAWCAGLLPVCTYVGTRSEGWWVQAALGDHERSFIAYDFCSSAAD